jgi:hypothetical protein
MITSVFKESYSFLDNYFLLTIAKKNILAYQPTNLSIFFSEYYQHFTITVKKETNSNFYELKIDTFYKSKKYYFLNEIELIEKIKNELVTRKTIGKLKRIFNV